jgi:hypothetical protein
VFYQIVGGLVINGITYNLRSYFANNGTFGIQYGTTGNYDTGGGGGGGGQSSIRNYTNYRWFG